MICPFKILFGLLLGVIVCVAGCSTVPGAGSGFAANNPTTAKQPAELILLSENIPQGFSMIENRMKNATDVSQLALDLGWRGGYIARYQKDEDLSSSPTIISHNIAIYPAKILPEILRRGRIMSGSQEQYIIRDLPDPGIGDTSGAIVAYEVIKPDVALQAPGGPGLNVPDSTTLGIPANGQHLAYYEISFTRGDVYEIIRMSGPSSDYKTLLDLARTAYEKT